MSTGLAGCSVDPEINRGARKLARTSQVIKKKKKGFPLFVSGVCSNQRMTK
jgi:hypothetical protein